MLLCLLFLLFRFQLKIIRKKKHYYLVMWSNSCTLWLCDPKCWSSVNWCTVGAYTWRIMAWKLSKDKVMYLVATTIKCSVTDFLPNLKNQQQCFNYVRCSGIIRRESLRLFLSVFGFLPFSPSEFTTHHRDLVQMKQSRVIMCFTEQASPATVPYYAVSQTDWMKPSIVSQNVMPLIWWWLQDFIVLLSFRR